MSHENLPDREETLPAWAWAWAWARAWAPGTDVSESSPSRGWVTARGRVSGLLLALQEAELEEGATLPAPLTGGAALRAWGAARSGSRTSEHRDAVEILGGAARLLGFRLCVLRATGAGDVTTEVLLREAAVHGCAPERLVAELARVHGVLAAPDPVSAAVVWHALEDTTRP